MTETTHQKFGCLALLGAPNAGKSTLTNALVGEKVTIVTRKVQTTRSNLLGIGIHGDLQLALYDTPGVFDARGDRFNQGLVDAAWESIDEADVIGVMVDAARGKLAKGTTIILSELDKRRASLEKAGVKVVLILNKVDLVKGKDKLLFMAQELNTKHQFDATFMITADDSRGKQDGLDHLWDYLTDVLPKQPWGYDPDTVSTIPAQLQAAEITREKVFNLIHQEIPYGATVIPEKWDTDPDTGRITIHQAIIIEKDSHKPIIIGKGGQKLKHIGQTAREEISETFGARVHLQLFVKVIGNWKSRHEYRQG